MKSKVNQLRAAGLYPERDIEAYLKTRVKQAGGETRKVRWIGRVSAPDRRIMLPGFACWVECKATGAQPTPAQDREHCRLRKMGEDVRVVNSFRAIDILVAPWLP